MLTNLRKALTQMESHYRVFADAKALVVEIEEAERIATDSLKKRDAAVAESKQARDEAEQLKAANRMRKAAADAEFVTKRDEHTKALGDLQRSLDESKKTHDADLATLRREFEQAKNDFDAKIADRERTLTALETKIADAKAYLSKLAGMG